MNVRLVILRLFRDERGAVISTELAMWVTLLSVGIIVGLASVRWALLDVFMDAGTALANRETGFVFSTADARLYFQEPNPSVFDTNPQIGTDPGSFSSPDATSGEN